MCHDFRRLLCPQPTKQRDQIPLFLRNTLTLAPRDNAARYNTAQYLNNVLEQDHRAIKRRIRASQHFRSFWGAWRTIAGYEAVHMMRKGQACESTKVGLPHRFILGLFAATS